MTHHVYIGESKIPVPVNDYEWLASTLAKDTPVSFVQKQFAGPPIRGVGTFKFSYMYDGVAAVVGLTGGKTVGLMLSCGDTIAVLEDQAGASFIGEGI